MLQNSNLEMLFSDSNYYKAQALKNAEDAYQIHQARVCIFWIREVEKKAEWLVEATEPGSFIATKSSWVLGARSEFNSFATFCAK